MPLYIRNRQLDIPTPTISSVASEDEAIAFISDPEQMFDELPMPFRLIDKIIYKIVEDSWENITKRQIERELDAKRFKPPCKNPDRVFEEYDSVSCISTSLKDKLFVAHGSKLKLKQLDNDGGDIKWQTEDNSSIESLTCVALDNDYSAVGIVDDMGFGKLLVVAESTFHVVRVMNEQTEGSAKSNLTKFEFSDDGEFCACAFECGDDAWVEIYKIPKDSWAKEIDIVKKEFIKKSESNIDLSQESDVENDSEEQIVKSEIISFPEIKFSPLTQVLKVKQPGEILAAQVRTTQDLLDSVSIGDVLGRGNLHCMTPRSVTIQDALFDHCYHEDLKYLEEKKVTVHSKPSFHFLRSSNMEQGLMYNPLNTSYVNVTLWWTKTNILNVFSLTKSGKDLEFKPDLVLPQTSYISCTSLSPCGHYLAVGLNCGALTVWDREFGQSIFTLNITDSEITNIFFLPENYKDDVMRVNSGLNFEELQDVKLLVGCSNGEVFNMNITGSPLAEDQVKSIVKPSTQFADKFQYLSICQNLPEVFLKINNNGEILLLDSRSGNVLCKLLLNEDFICDLPSNIKINFSTSGDLFVVGSSVVEAETSLLTSHAIANIPALHSFLELHKTKEESKANEPNNFMNCVQELLTNRITRQNDRTTQLAARWHNMTKQLGFLLDLKEKVNIHKKSYRGTNSSPSRWSKTTSKVLSRKAKA